MASLATLACVQPAGLNVKGLAGSSITGTKLSFKPSRQSFKSKNLRYFHNFELIISINITSMPYSSVRFFITLMFMFLKYKVFVVQFLFK